MIFLLVDLQCGQRLKNIQPNEYMCLGSFETNANFETRLEVDGSTHSTDEVQAKGKGSEWFYAPALSVYDHGAGPKVCIIFIARHSRKGLNDLLGFETH